MSAKTNLITGSIVLFVAILLGAFGAHGLEKVLAPSKLKTFHTGVDYQLYHGIGLLIVGCVQAHFMQLNTKLVSMLMLAGIVLFSGFCYAYAITGTKALAMVVPFGGVCYIAAWASLAWQLRKI